MTKLSETTGRPDAETRKRVQSEAEMVADVTPPPWRKKLTLGGQKKKA